MKTILIAFTFVLSAAAFSADVAPMTFDKIILTKDTKNSSGIVYVPNRHVKTWCAGLGNPMSIMSYEAAETMEKLADGLYTCTGKFVQVPTERSFPVQIFQIDSCSEVNPADFRTASCTVVK